MIFQVFFLFKWNRFNPHSGLLLMLDTYSVNTYAANYKTWWLWPCVSINLLKLLADSWLFISAVLRFKLLIKRQLLWKTELENSDIKKSCSTSPAIVVQVPKKIKNKAAFCNNVCLSKKVPLRGTKAVWTAFAFSHFKHTSRTWHSTSVKNVSWILIEKLYACQGVLSSPCYPYGFQQVMVRSLPSWTGKVSKESLRTFKCKFLSYCPQKPFKAIIQKMDVGSRRTFF